jgi:hypothetical protein
LAPTVAKLSSVGGKPATSRKRMSSHSGDRDTGTNPSVSSEPPPMITSTSWRQRFSNASWAAPGFTLSTTMVFMSCFLAVFVTDLTWPS